MGSFQRALLGYRRPEVDAAMEARDERIHELSQRLADRDELESELAGLSGMVIEREREIRTLNEKLQEANDRYDRSIASLDAVTTRLEEIETQARGQATRIRMKALREAVEVGRRVQELSDAEVGGGAVDAPPAATNGHPVVEARELFEGQVKVEVGPLGDYAQLVGIEDAIGQLGATDVSIERFSEGRATLSMHLDEPIELLRALEEHAPLEFHVRRAGDDVALDVDDDQGPGQHAA